MATADQRAKDENSGVAVSSEFVRHRNVLVTRARVTDLYLDHYLQLADAGVHIAAEHDRIFKDMLAAFLLHAASRPRNEFIAWTINLQEPLLNLFATADNSAGTIVGRVFTRDVRQGDSNLFYVETQRLAQPLQRSVIDFSGADIFAAAELFYARSEQRSGRFFNLGDEEFALLVAHPDCDVTWLSKVGAQEVREHLGHETVVLMERRRYSWHCGCNEQRIFKILAPAMRQDPDDLFRGEEVVHIECPRCGMPYRISREAFEAYLAQKNG